MASLSVGGIACGYRTVKSNVVGVSVLNKLTDLAIRSFIRNSKTGTAPTRKLSDGGGLYLFVTSAGTPVWRVKYRFNAKERVFAAGAYPSTTLEAARAE